MCNSPYSGIPVYSVVEIDYSKIDQIMIHTCIHYKAMVALSNVVATFSNLLFDSK